MLMQYRRYRKPLGNPCANLWQSEDARKILESCSEPGPFASKLEIRQSPSKIICKHGLKVDIKDMAHFA